jgi:effector-binding domain-containing protein
VTQEPKLERRGALPYVAIRRHVMEQRVAAAVDSAFPELFRWLGEHGIDPVGPPFIRFLEVDQDGEPLELEVGAPVEDPVRGDDRVQVHALPAGRYVTLLHLGPYRHATEPDLPAARRALQDWARKEGVVLDGRKTDRGSAWGAYVEHYLIGPVDEPDYSKWETELMYLVSEG